MPFASTGLACLVVDCCACRAVRRLVDEDPVDRGRALQAGSRVDDVAGRHTLACVGLSVEAHERLAGRDPDAQLQVFLERELADRERCANGALGIVLVRRRRAEKRHHRIPDELLDGAAVALELFSDALVIRAEESFDVFGIHRLSPSREPDEVAEDHRDDLALTPRCTPRHA